MSHLKISWLTQNKARTELLLSGSNVEGTTWYSQYESPSEESTNKSLNHRNTAQQLLPKVREVVGREFIKEEELYLKKRKSRKDPDEKWIREVSVSGTLSDKIAALSLIIQESPIHNLKSLDTLLEYVRKDQRSAQLAIEALKDLFTHSVLPDRKLVSFAARDFTDSRMTLALALVHWYEDQLISRVKVFVDGLEEGLKSNIEFYKKFCMDVVCDMLISKPEQEARLLSLLVNKLGDPSKATVYKCTQLLEKVLSTHPVMKSVVVREVRQFMNRPSLPPRALYTAVTFLTYIRFSKSDGEVALQLVECYISLFEKAVKQEDYGSKLLSSLLHGINRAYPYLQSREALVKYVDPLFKISHNENFATAVQALTLISYIALGSIAEQKHKSKSLAKKGSTKNGKEADINGDGGNTVPDDASAVDAIVNRFYRSLYAILFTDQIASRTRNTMFFRLLFRSMKSDPSELRLLAFIKKLCMISLHSQAAIAAGILLMVAEVCGQRKSILQYLHSKKLITVANDNTGEEKYAVSPESQLFDSYDASKREPLFASKAAPKLWEKHLLAHHYHPSVKAFATSFFHPPHVISYDGDPIADFNVSAFLNRFAYKNPKQKAAKGDEKTSKGQAKKGVVADEEPINMLLRDEAGGGDMSLNDVAPDKQFFYRYFGERSQLLSEGKLKLRSRKKSADGDDEEDGAGDDEEEMDAFADRLATDMIRTHNRTADPDFDEDEDGLFPDEDDDDDDDEDDDDEDDDDEDEDEDDDGEFTSWNKAVKSEDGEFPEENDDEEDEEDAMDFETSPKKQQSQKQKKIKTGSTKQRGVNSDSDSDEEGGYQLAEYTGEDDDNNNDFDVPVPASKLSKKKKIKKGKRGEKEDDDSMADFADADEYEAQVDAAMSRFGSIEADDTLPVDGKRGRERGIDFGQNVDDDDDDEDEAFFNGNGKTQKQKLVVKEKGKNKKKNSGLKRLRRF